MYDSKIGSKPDTALVLMFSCQGGRLESIDSIYMKQEITKWESLEREIVFKKYSRKVEKVIYKMPDNRIEDYYLFNDAYAIATLALTENNEVILVRQFRPGPNEILLEMPGGAVEDGESPEVGAARELLEETGYAGEVEIVGQAFDDAYSTGERFCAIARNCKKIGEQQLDKTEFIEVVLVSIHDFREILRSGKMTDIEIGYMALDHLGLL